MSLNKAIHWKKIEKENFKRFWKERKKFIKQTNSFRINQMILKNGFELKEFFKGLIDLTPGKEADYFSGNCFLKFAGCFHFFNQNKACYIKFILTPTKRLCIKINDESLSPENQVFSENLLNTLEFLFSSE